MTAIILIVAAIFIVWAFQLLSETAKHEGEIESVPKKAVPRPVDAFPEPIASGPEGAKPQGGKKGVIVKVVLVVAAIVILFIVGSVIFMGTTSMNSLKTAMEACVAELGLKENPGNLEHYFKKFNVSSEEELNALVTKCVEGKMIQDKNFSKILKHVNWQ